MGKRFYIHTFGCQMNVHDSGKMAELLKEAGHSEASEDLEADLILFNTCTVRDHAHQKAISEIGRAVGRKKRNRDLVVGVCGCVAQKEKERLFLMYPELDLVLGPDQIARLPELLKDLKVAATELIDDPAKYIWVSTKDKTPSDVPARVSRFVTIMKGCNNTCSFCIVPFVRGHEISKPPKLIIDEIRYLVSSGTKEVTLLGQNVNSYDGPSTGGVSPFVDLIRRISGETDIKRLRYTSPHPKDLCDDLIGEHANNPKLCRHMHLPLQSGSDPVLRMMKRSYNRRQFIEKALKLRKAVDGIDITTDIIVGFPGETEKDFQDTLEVVREVAFDGMFAFKYSPRPGTKAAELKDDVPQEEKERRLATLLALNSELWREKTSKLIGTTQQVLVESISKRGSFGPNANAPKRSDTLQMSGRTFANKIVNFTGNLQLVGHIVPVRITDAGANSLRGELCNSSK